jgi:hypothetical protein
MDMTWLFEIGPYHWLALAAILIGLEMVLPTHYLIWPGIASAITGVIALGVAIGWPAQLAIFALLSVALVVGSSYLPKPASEPVAGLNQRTDQLVGRLATVADDFQNGQGSVTLGDTRWSAQSVDGSDLPAGTKVEVVAAESTLLKVKRA